MVGSCCSPRDWAGDGFKEYGDEEPEPVARSSCCGREANGRVKHHLRGVTRLK